MLVKDSLRQAFEEKLKLADIQLDGSNPWDIQVHDERFFNRIIKDGSLGLGESYMDGWWSAQKIDEVIYRLLKADLASSMKLSLTEVFQAFKYLILNLQTKKRAFVVGKEHYDVGNDLFVKMLDKHMAYSCAYWRNAKNLDEAQTAKLDLICRKLHLKPGLKVLDIGCGWGSFTKYAAEKYGVEVDGITVSQQQLELAKQRCQGLPVHLHYQDYRDVTGQYDRIVSVGQMEHVGSKNYKTFMETCFRSLKEDGLFLLHTIGHYSTCNTADPWVEKYIFPNGMIPSSAQIADAANNLFVIEDWHNFGRDYDLTLLAWHENFVRNWDALKAHYDERFYHMWEYYLLACAGAFRSRDLQLWQVVFSKKEYPELYISAR